MECEYQTTFLKKKLDRKDQIDEQNLEDLYFTALRTVHALMNLLLMGKLYERVRVIYDKDEMVCP